MEWKPGAISDIAYYTIKYREDDFSRKNPNFYYYYYDDHHYDSESDNSIDENFVLTNQIDDNSENNDDNEMKEDLYGNNDYSYSYENTTNTKYKIQAKLKPFTFYKFQVFAVNLFGENKRSLSIRVRTAASSINLNSCFSYA